PACVPWPALVWARKILQDPVFSRIKFLLIPATPSGHDLWGNTTCRPHPIHSPLPEESPGLVPNQSRGIPPDGAKIHLPEKLAHKPVPHTRASRPQPMFGNRLHGRTLSAGNSPGRGVLP